MIVAAHPKLIFLFLELPGRPFHAPGGHGVCIRHVLHTSCIRARCPSAYFLQPFHSFYPVTTHFSELSLNAPWLRSRCGSFLFVFQKLADMNKNSHLTSRWPFLQSQSSQKGHYKRSLLLVSMGLVVSVFVHLVLLLHLLHLAELLWRQHALDPLHVPHEEALRLEELVIGPLPRVLQLVVLLPLQLQLVTHWGRNTGQGSLSARRNCFTWPQRWLTLKCQNIQSDHKLCVTLKGWLKLAGISGLQSNPPTHLSGFSLHL